MLIRSFAFEHRKLIPVEVELTLWPGLPCIQFVGLPDQQIKESAWRIKSAIKSQGFEFPKSQQILVNLRPNALKKSSQGLELAVAVAFLMESEQIQKIPERELKKYFYYGSLSLSGEVSCTSEVSALKDSAAGRKLITGLTMGPPAKINVLHSQISSLQDLSKPLEFQAPVETQSLQRPEIDASLKWNPRESEILLLAAAGGHHTLLAGPSGSGKTTIAKMIHNILPTPLASEMDEIAGAQNWRPLASPHHSVTRRGLIGGGADVSEGEISRSNGGILLLDEFLEFRPEVLESLREPLESGFIHLARGARSEALPTNFQLIATTNLCPCGRWVPGIRKTYCRFSLFRCRSYNQRLSGPILDRFQILHFSFQQAGSKIQERSISTEELIEKIEAASEFRRKRGQFKPNASLSLTEIWKGTGASEAAQLLPEKIGSERRRLATLRVARTFADLDLRKQMLATDLQKSLQYTYVNFQALGQWD